MRPLIVLAGSEMPTELLGRQELRRRQYAREAVPEFRFGLADPRPRIPIRATAPSSSPAGAIPPGGAGRLPRAALTRQAKVEAGEWAKYGAMPVEIAATLLVRGRGLVLRARGHPRGCSPPTRRGGPSASWSASRRRNYYRNMTGCDWMPVFLNQRY